MAECLCVSVSQRGLRENHFMRRSVSTATGSHNFESKDDTHDALYPGMFYLSKTLYLPIIASRLQTRFPLFVEVKLFAKRLRDVPVHCFEFLLIPTRSAFKHTSISLHNFPHSKTVDISFFVFLEQMKNIFVSFVPFFV